VKSRQGELHPFDQDELKNPLSEAASSNRKR
jgi:hypothetical protein